MAQILGIDTSNYTTSAALLDLETGEVHQEKQLLPVKAGEAGLRQSDAVFHHTRQLPELLERLSRQADPPADGLFAGCREGLSSLGERSLAELWKAGVRQPALLLEAEELALLDGLGQVLGSYDGEGQLAALAQTCAALERALAEARSERKRMGRVYQTLGLAAGAFLAILLV